MFVVVRFDRSDVEQRIENCLSAVAVYGDQLAAEDEAARLGRLRPDNRSEYFVLSTRLKGRLLAGP